MGKTVHGLYSHRLYTVWNAMHQRCYNPNQVGYAHYGARGIEVSADWHGTEGLIKFIGDMDESFKEGLWLERTDNSLGYSKENCCWESGSQQMYNRRAGRNNTSGRIGVSFANDGRARPWSAYIYKERKRNLLGYFATFEEAVIAREQAELELYGKIKG